MSPWDIGFKLIDNSKRGFERAEARCERRRTIEYRQVRYHKHSKKYRKHNNGNGSNMVKKQGPFILVYESETFSNKSEAGKREVWVKKRSRVKKEKLIEGEWK